MPNMKWSKTIYRNTCKCKNNCTYTKKFSWNLNCFRSTGICIFSTIRIFRFLKMLFPLNTNCWWFKQIAGGSSERRGSSAYTLSFSFVHSENNFGASLLNGRKKVSQSSRQICRLTSQVLKDDMFD